MPAVKPARRGPAPQAEESDPADPGVVFATRSQSAAQRATDLLRDAGIEALLRMDWRCEGRNGFANAIRYGVVVPANARRAAVRLLLGHQLEGEVAASACGRRISATAILIALVAATTACGVWLAVRATG
jgi:hypothetical protein